MASTKCVEFLRGVPADYEMLNALVGICLGVLAALWTSSTVERPAHAPLWLVRPQRTEDPEPSWFASCAPVQSCPRVVGTPSRSRLLGPARNATRRDYAEWRTKYSAEAMLERIRACSSKKNKCSTAPRVERGSPKKCSPQRGSFVSRVRAAVGHRATVVASIVDEERVEALSQIETIADVVVAVGEHARRAACALEIRRVDYPEVDEFHASLVVASSELPRRMAKWALVDVLATACSFVVFDAEVFFTKSPLHLLDLVSHDNELVVALRTGMDLRNTPTKRYRKPIVSAPRPTDCVLAYRRGRGRYYNGGGTPIPRDIEAAFNASAIAAFDAETIVSQEHPVVFPRTVAVHVRGGDDPFPGHVHKGNRGGGDATVPFVSIARLAKELGLWREPRSSRGRRFVALEDYALPSTPPDFHSGDKLVLILFNLVALAFLTRRTLVVPAFLHFEKHFYGFEFVDLDHLASSLGVDSRPSRFFAPDGLSQARIALSPDGAVGVQTSSARRWYQPDADRRTGARQNPSGLLRKRLLFAVANEDDLATNADVLFVDLDAPHQLNTLAFPERACLAKFLRHPPDCERYGRVESWLSALHARLRYCSWDASHLRTLNLLAASDDCTARRADDDRRRRASAANATGDSKP